MKCPNCRSATVQRTEMVWATQTQTGSFVGGTTDADGVMMVGSSSTPLGRGAAPPEKPDRVLALIAFGAAVVAAVLAFQFSNIEVGVVAALLTVGGVAASFHHQRRTIDWQAAYDRWRAQWTCLACGATFIQAGATGGVGQAKCTTCLRPISVDAKRCGYCHTLIPAPR